MDNSVVGAQSQGTQIGCHCSIKDPSLLQDIPQVDVSIKEGGVQLHGLGGRGRGRGESIPTGN